MACPHIQNATMIGGRGAQRLCGWRVKRLDLIIAIIARQSFGIAVHLGGFARAKPQPGNAGQQDPFEAGIGFAVPLKTKEEDFIGKEELIKRKNNPQKKLVGLELIGKEIAGHGDCVHIGRAQVGIVTSGCLSSTLNKNVALCRIDSQYSEIGTTKLLHG